jgi:hypothetical protein
MLKKVELKLLKLALLLFGVWRMMRWLLIELSVVLTAVVTWKIYSALRPPLFCERGPDSHIQRGFESV